MKRRSSTLPQIGQTRLRPARTGISPQQKLILFLASLLVAAWTLFAIGFFLSGRMHLTRQDSNLAPAPTGQLASPTATYGENTPTAAIAISAACTQGNSSREEGKVTQVESDGSLQVSTPDGILEVRLAGIELAQAGQPGNLALQTLREMVENQLVLLVRDVSLSEGSMQTERFIFTSSHFVNEELVRQGLASVNPASASQSCAADFHLAEQKARREQAGIWKPTPVPTRTFMPFVTLDVTNHPACDCSKRYECSDFATHNEAQACYNACNDYNSRLDPDRDGIACEGLP